MDFIIKLPRIMKQHDSITVVVDKLKKVSHFIPVKLTHKVANIAKIYMREIARLHGVPKEIFLTEIPNLDQIFRKVYLKYSKQIEFSTTYHPESNG
jgi:hypothetical protein